MAVTVALDEQLAQQLQRQADVGQVSVEDLAVQILHDAVRRPLVSGAWKNINARRLELIAVEYSQGLSDAETLELDALQDAVTKACEPEDRQLLKTLDDAAPRATGFPGTSDE